MKPMLKRLADASQKERTTEFPVGVAIQINA
jgi:hypothetical protein